MRFRKWPRISAYEDTSRKRAALVRGQRLQREKLPLLAGLIAEQQPSADEEMTRRTEWWNKAQQADRGLRARKWREARTRLASYDAPLRRILIALWKECPYPADPSYLLDLLHSIDKGAVDPIRPPWKYHKPLTPRITANPTSFDKAFKQIGHRKTGGGPKTTPADEFIFMGNLGSGPIFLHSRVRLTDPNESLNSCVGDTGHWIDIVVNGPCPDGDLALIQRLAQEADARPVVVRRGGAASSSQTSPTPGAPP